MLSTSGSTTKASTSGISARPLAQVLPGPQGARQCSTSLRVHSSWVLNNCLTSKMQHGLHKHQFMLIPEPSLAAGSRRLLRPVEAFTDSSVYEVPRDDDDDDDEVKR